MPHKMNMVISNGNNSYSLQARQANNNAINMTSLAAPKAPSALNAPFIARIQNVKPGCGGCGRH